MNTLTICRKELNSYFRSPIAYGVMAFFALIAGYFFYVAVVFFVQRNLLLYCRTLCFFRVCFLVSLIRCHCSLDVQFCNSLCRA